MMMRNNFKKVFLVFSLFSLFSSAFCQNQTNWVLAAQKFSYKQNKQDSLSEGITLMFPSRILEKLSTNLTRTVDVNEKLARNLYSLKTERTSLFLQLSAEVKKRDSLVTGKYSKKELEKKINEFEEKIQNIRKSIDENIEKQKELENQYLHPEENKDKKKKSFFQSVLPKEETEVSLEKINFYKNDYSAVFTPSENVISLGYLSSAFEKEIVSNNINALLTGKISQYGDYVSVTVEMYLYPGAKLIATVTEIGNLNDADFIATSIARELAPAITNAMPVTIKLSIMNESLDSEIKMYIDDVLQAEIPEKFTIDSGIHYFQFIADGYDSVGATFAFLGNKYYEIKVLLSKSQPISINVKLKNPVEGNFYANGQTTEKLNQEYSKIYVNGKQVLGEFIVDKKNNGFFYLPENAIEDNVTFEVPVNPINTSDYIEKHRRRMYFSYSMLITSLIPMFYIKGQYNSYENAYALGTADISKVKGWNAASIVSTSVTIGCGAWFIYELVRYMISADSVLPKEAYITEDMVLPLPEEETESDTDIIENQENTNTNGEL